MRYVNVCVVALVAGCGEPGGGSGSEPAGSDTGEVSSDGGMEGTAGSRGDGGSSDAPGDSSSAGPGPATGDTTGEPVVDAPELAWMEQGESAEHQPCVDVVPAPDGGMVATHFTDGLFAVSGRTTLLDGAGEIIKIVSAGEGRFLTGLRPRAEDLFEWISSDAGTGITGIDLSFRGAQSFGDGVVGAYGFAGRGDRRAAFLDQGWNTCVVRRTDVDPPTDSVPITCPESDWPSATRFGMDGAGNMFVFDLFAGRVRRFDPAGLAWGELSLPADEEAYDAAVDAQGAVWLVGVTEVGAFVARYDDILDRAPSYLATVDQLDAAWTAITLVDDGAIVIGEREARTYALRLDGQDETVWEAPYDLGVGVILDRVTTAADGSVLACGRRLLPPEHDPFEGALFVKLHPEQGR